MSATNESGYVFDTEPLIAYLYDEPGAAAVSARLDDLETGEASGSIAHATATELVYKIARLETGEPNRSTPDEDHLAVGEHDLRVIRGFGVSIETPTYARVAAIKSRGGISLGDSYAAALAVETDATLIVGADPEFGDLEADVDLYSIRDEAV